MEDNELVNAEYSEVNPINEDQTLNAGEKVLAVLKNNPNAMPEIVAANTQRVADNEEDLTNLIETVNASTTTNNNAVKKIKEQELTIKEHSAEIEKLKQTKPVASHEVTETEYEEQQRRFREGYYKFTN